MRTVNSNEGQTTLIFHMSILSDAFRHSVSKVTFSRQRTEEQQINLCKTNVFRLNSVFIATGELLVCACVCVASCVLSGPGGKRC